MTGALLYRLNHGVHIIGANGQSYRLNEAKRLCRTSTAGRDRQERGDDLVGRDDQGTVHHPELTRGSFDWIELKQMVTAPKGAVRMALFFGLLPCRGELDFDEINLKTREGAVGRPAAQEILPPRLPLRRIKEAFFVDLSAVANRGLADEVDNDGQGGWSDQGSNADMRELRTGDREFGGVPFRLLPAPRSIVVLRSTSRNPGGLPETVTIPLGRKADTLFFLQSVAWGGGPGEMYRYVINYHDGVKVSLPVSDRNMTDWAAEPVRRFATEEGSFTTVAETVPSKMFGQGSVYRKEWNAPDDRRPVVIDSIVFTCPDGKASVPVPILLAITGVTEW